MQPHCVGGRWPLLRYLYFEPEFLLLLFRTQPCLRSSAKALTCCRLINTADIKWIRRAVLCKHTSWAVGTQLLQPSCRDVLNYSGSAKESIRRCSLTCKCAAINFNTLHSFWQFDSIQAVNEIQSEWGCLVNKLLIKCVRKHGFLQ